MKSKGNILLPIISAVALIAIVIAGYLFYQNQQLQKNNAPANSIPNSNTTNPKFPNTPPQDETANWKIYTNSELGFKIKYPDTMYFQEQSTNINPGPIIPFGQLIETKYQNQQVHNPFIGFNLIKTALSPQDWEKQKGTSYSFIGGGNAPKSIDPSQYFYSGVTNLGPYTNISQVEATRFNSEGTSYGLTHTVWKLKAGFLIDIYKHTSGLGEIPTNVYDQILSTFKFISSPPKLYSGFETASKEENVLIKTGDFSGPTEIEVSGTVLTLSLGKNKNYLQLYKDAINYYSEYFNKNNWQHYRSGAGEPGEIEGWRKDGAYYIVEIKLDPLSGKAQQLTVKFN